jgi:hypothetical protein
MDKFTTDELRMFLAIFRMQSSQLKGADSIMIDLHSFESDSIKSFIDWIEIKKDGKSFSELMDVLDKF